MKMSPNRFWDRVYDWFGWPRYRLAVTTVHPEVGEACFTQWDHTKGSRWEILTNIAVLKTQVFVSGIHMYWNVQKHHPFYGWMHDMSPEFDAFEWRK